MNRRWPYIRVGAWVCISVLNAICNPMAFSAEESLADELKLQDLLELPIEELMKLSVVTTTRAPAYSHTVPFKVIIISREEIQQQLALTTDTSQILANLIPGFSPSQQKLSGRGENLRGRNQLMMVDGIPQSNPLRDSSRDSFTLDLEMVERIEVIYGANAIQGMGASGGIVNFITINPSQTQSTQIGSHLAGNDQLSGDSLGYKLGIQYQHHVDQLSLLLAATLETRGLYFDGNNQPLGLEQIQGDLMDTRSHDILFKAGYSVAQQRIQLTYHDYTIAAQGDFVNVPGNVSQDVPASSKPGDISGDPPANNIKFIAIDYNHSDIAGGGLALKLFQQEFAATFGASETAILQDPGLGDHLIDQSQINSDKQGIKLSYSLADWGEHPLDVATGVDYLHDSNIQVLLMTDRVWSPKMNFESWAPFINAEYRLGERATINAGLRRELAQLNVNDYRTIASSNNTQVMGSELTFEETLRNLGLVYHLTPHWSTSLSYGEGFGMPDAGRVLRSVNTTGFKVADFLEIAPIVTTNRELGLRYTGNSVKAQLSYFESITPYGTRLVMNNSVFTLGRERVEISGWELNGDWQVSANHHLGLIYSHTRSLFDSNNDNRVDSDLSAMEAPPDRLLIHWTQRWSEHWSSRLQLDHDFSRSFYTQGNKTGEFDGYTLADISINYHIAQSNFSLGITNLTDRHYISYLAQTDMQRNDRYYAGRGRSFLLGYRQRF